MVAFGPVTPEPRQIADLAVSAPCPGDASPAGMLGCRDIRAIQRRRQDSVPAFAFDTSDLTDAIEFPILPDLKVSRRSSLTYSHSQYAIDGHAIPILR